MSHLPRGQKDLEQQCHIIFNAMSASDHGFSMNSTMLWLIVHSTVCKNWRYKKLSLNCHSSTNTKSPSSLYLICMLRGQVQFSSVAQSCPTHCDPMDCSTPGLPVHHQLLEFTQTHVHWVDDASNHLILCCPLLLLSSIFPSIRIFSNESVLPMRWPKYWSFSFSISPSKQHSGLISFRTDWFDLLAVQGKPLNKDKTQLNIPWQWH